jgi:aminoglycoside phosphotransferase (APT) family kinase protein
VESRSNRREVRPEFATRTIEPVIDGMASLGVRYEVVRKLPGGAWGAWLVRGGDGRVAVLKCLWDADWRDRIASASRVVDVLASRGAPVPRYLVSGYTPELGTWYAQEYLSGQRIEQLSASLLADVFSLNDMQAGADESHRELFNWSAHLQSVIEQDAPRWLALLRSESRRAARLANEIDALFRREESTELTVSDFVHGDFLATQLLSEDGVRLTGVIDWDAAGVGDRAQDLSLLLYNLYAQAGRLGVEPNDRVIEAVVRRGVEVSRPESFGTYLAYEVLDALAFVILKNRRHVNWRVSLGERALEAFFRHH